MVTTSTIIGAVLNLLAPFINQAQVVDINQLTCLADNIYFEAGGESREGKKAVAHVVLNRVKDPAYKRTICGVVREGLQPGRLDCQFSWVCDHRDNTVPLDKAASRKMYYECVEEAVFAYIGLSEDPTSGATYYFAHNIVTPKWSKSAKLKTTTVIEHHTFMADSNDLNRFNNPIKTFLTASMNP